MSRPSTLPISCPRCHARAGEPCAVMKPHSGAGTVATYCHLPRTDAWHEGRERYICRARVLGKPSAFVDYADGDVVLGFYRDRTFSVLCRESDGYAPKTSGERPFQVLDQEVGPLEIVAVREA